MRQLKHSKTDETIHFISGANSYMFRQQGAIIRKFMNNEVSYKCPTSISGAIRPHFHHKCYKS